MKAIHTKFLPATNTHGSRIKAYVHKGLSATIDYPHEFSHELCHFQAVKALVAKHKLDWDIGRMTYGDSADGKGFTFCFADSVVVE